MIDVALMGCGRWGSRLLSMLVSHPRMRVKAVVDTDAAARARARELAPEAMISATLDGEAEAVVIATPSRLHARHALAALDAGLDVLVEKPLATSARDADALCDRIAKSDRIGAVGHVLRFHPAVCGFVSRVVAGDVGVPIHLRSRRFTCSGSPDALWTLGPHDLATLRAIDPSEVVTSAVARRNGIAELTLEMRSGLRASIEVSTQVPAVERRTVVEGSAGSAHLDELRDGHGADPLARQLDHFASCVIDRSKPRTCFEDARWVVATLERAIQADGRRTAP